MSIAVAIEDLPVTASAYTFAYVITVSDAATAHLSATVPEWDDAAVPRATVSVGRSTIAHVVAGRAVTLCYPPPDASGYSLIVDGTATAGDAGVQEGTIVVTPTAAVLHRPASPSASP
jgi:hypothetical protein